MTLPQHARIAIIGSGFAGIGMAVRLREAGIHDFVLLERGQDVGGTWRDNSYPGAACDVPSHLYSFSFALNPDWSRSFSPQSEIQDYLVRVARDFGVLPHVRFGCEVTEAAYDEEQRTWLIETTAGSLTADVVISAAGALSEPAIPDLPGLQSFAGTVFHSAQWDHSYDLRGKRVAVVGTGASAIQFVPQIQPEVERLHLFQRTPPWVMPRSDRALRDWEKALFDRVPLAQRAVRSAIYWGREVYVLGFAVNQRILSAASVIARRHLERQVTDPVLRAKLRPSYVMGCKRILLSNDYYPALTQPNVEVVASGVRAVTPTSVVASDGTEAEVDAIVFGTGFHVTDQPIASRLRGIGGRTLEEAWQGSASAYKGTSVAGFPNLFLLLGPNTGLGHTSQVFMIESQVAYVLDAITTMDRQGILALDVRPEAQAAWTQEIDRDLAGTVWAEGGCSSWYIDATGRNPTLWPGATWRFRLRTRSFDLASYDALRDSRELVHAAARVSGR